MTLEGKTEGAGR